MPDIKIIVCLHSETTYYAKGLIRRANSMNITFSKVGALPKPKQISQYSHMLLPFFRAKEVSGMESIHTVFLVYSSKHDLRIMWPGIASLFVSYLATCSYEASLDLQMFNRNKETSHH